VVDDRLKEQLQRVPIEKEDRQDVVIRRVELQFTVRMNKPACGGSVCLRKRNEVFKRASRPVDQGVPCCVFLGAIEPSYTHWIHAT